MITLLIGWLAPLVGEKAAKPVAWAAIVLAILVALGTAKCAYDKSVIRQHEQKAALEQIKRERKADTNLQQQIGRDDAASQQRREEIDNATRDIPDQAPSARQRAIACAELVRDAKARHKPVPAC